MAAQARGSGVTMLRAAWRALSSVRAQAVTQAPGSALRSGGSANLPSARCGPRPPSLLLAARAYATQKPVQHSRDDEPPPSTFIKEYNSILPNMEKVDDVVKKVLSLEMANKKEKSKVKQEQWMNKIAENPEDSRTLEAQRFLISYSKDGASWGQGRRLCPTMWQD